MPEFDVSVVEQLARVLEGVATHHELTGILAKCGIDGPAHGEGPKWHRIQSALTVRQQRDRCGNNVAGFIQAMMNPVRFIGRLQAFADARDRLNEVLAFVGLHLGEDAKLTKVSQAATLVEAAERAGRLRNELTRRSVHADVLAFCRAELLQQNYFHAVFEATKSVAEKIRRRTGLVGDGADIVNAAFGLRNPLLALNTLRSETEQSEQKGFANLLVGIFGTFRNVTAHSPKVMWTMSEQDALDLLTMVSYAHRRLDGAAVVPRVPPPTPASPAPSRP